MISIWIVGPKNAGKDSIKNRFYNIPFKKTNKTQDRFGVDAFKVPEDNPQFNLYLCCNDSHSKPTPKNIMSSAKAIMLVIDESADAEKNKNFVTSFLTEYAEYIKDIPHKFIVGAKTDINSDLAVAHPQALRLMLDFKLSTAIACSAKTVDGMQDINQHLQKICSGEQPRETEIDSETLTALEEYERVNASQQSNWASLFSHSDAESDSNSSMQQWIHEPEDEAREQNNSDSDSGCVIM